MIRKVENAADIQITEEQREVFAQWQQDNQEMVSQVAGIAQKSKEERTTEDEALVDQYAQEIRKVIPGGDQLTMEQVLALSFNLNLNNTRHAGAQIRSLDDAMAYVGSALQQPEMEIGHRDREEITRDMLRDQRATEQGVDIPSEHYFKEMPPLHTGGQAPDRGKDGPKR